MYTNLTHTRYRTTHLGSLKDHGIIRPRPPAKLRPPIVDESLLYFIHGVHDKRSVLSDWFSDGPALCDTGIQCEHVHVPRVRTEGLCMCVYVYVSMCVRRMQCEYVPVLHVRTEGSCMCVYVYVSVCVRRMQCEYVHVSDVRNTQALFKIRRCGEILDS